MEDVRFFQRVSLQHREGSSGTQGGHWHRDVKVCPVRVMWRLAMELSLGWCGGPGLRSHQRHWRGPHIQLHRGRGVWLVVSKWRDQRFLVLQEDWRGVPIWWWKMVRNSRQTGPFETRRWLDRLRCRWGRSTCTWRLVALHGLLHWRNQCCGMLGAAELQPLHLDGADQVVHAGHQEDLGAYGMWKWRRCSSIATTSSQCAYRGGVAWAQDRMAYRDTLLAVQVEGQRQQEKTQRCCHQAPRTCGKAPTGRAASQANW